MSELDRLYAQKKADKKRALRTKLIALALTLAFIAVVFFWGFGEPYKVDNLIAVSIMAFVAVMPLLVKLLGKFSPQVTPDKVQNLAPQTKISSQNLTTLESERIELTRLLFRAKIISLVACLLAGAGVYYFWEPLPAIFASVVVYGMIFGAMTLSEKAQFLLNFKSKIIGAIAQGRGLEYEPTSSLGLSEFFMVYSCRVDEWRGEDLISGQIDGVRIEFSDFWAAKKVKTKNGTRTVTLFHGTLFVADFNKNVSDFVFVCHKDSSNLAVKGSAVKMDDARFSEFFKVFASDNTTAFYVLTPVLMARILKISLQLNAPINLLFEGGKIYIAIETNSDSFAVDINAPVALNSDIAQYENELDEFTAIVKELNLNRKIWGEVK